MEKIREVLDKVLGYICCVLLVFMTLAATWQVISRYVLNNPSTVTEELTLISFIWTALFAAAYVFGKMDHMKMSFVLDKMNRRNNLRLKIVSEIIIAIFAIFILIFGGAKMCSLCMGEASSSLEIPMGYIYLALPISGVLTVIYNILNIHDMTVELKKEVE
ncbi:TRAP-type C4-dicarboxylate transport system, small permease component [Clostridium sp. DSM 8431]|uniref:TRAP transporter small permease n=1 Tax=Clostridium sp. DSM 8431 TaxID=1761781 RepID=UPI0008E98CDA|nr:TRAP transporter small permease [Clostridium sp. DSM 8431]SFU75278.1 TRAP-type C4-dicarboxylate transport system, small permease component [Clostridium sp. DSM 8431]